MFALPALVAMHLRPVTSYNHDGSVRPRNSAVWLLIWLVLTVLIGFRYEVGGDWNNYLRHFQHMEIEGWDFALSQPEFGHWLINKIISELGLGLTGVNIFYGAVFSAGFIAFSKTLPRPWLALATAIPYLIIVVAMGYSRQAAALGFAFIGLVALRRGKILRFSFLVLIGATIHNTVILLIPLAGLISQRGRLKAAFLIVLMSVLGYEFFLSGRIDGLVEVYVDQQLTASEGALIRLSMNAIPAMLFLFYRNVFTLNFIERRLWSIVSVLSVALLVAYFVTGLSTALDRIALYLMPIQMVAFSHLPDALGRRGGRNTQIVMLILIYFGAVQFIWLNFAAHAPAWLPFQLGIAN